MKKKLFVLLVLLLVSNDIAYGKDGNKTKAEPLPIKKNKTTKYKAIERSKRAAGDRGFHLPNDEDIISHSNLKLLETIKSDDIEDDPPFWGSRGRRDSSSSENLSELPHNSCHNCKSFCIPFNPNEVRDFPFWGNRGRRDSSSQSTENDVDSWDERVRRQDEEDDPFWASRGRRDEDPPFWASRGRREQSLRGKNKQMSTAKISTWYDDEDEPFWGSRGRRKMDKGRSTRQNEQDPFWASRGKKGKYKMQFTDEEREPFWGNRGRRKMGYSFGQDYPNDDIDNMLKSKRKEISTSFWANRGRESKLKNLFAGSVRSQVKFEPSTSNELNKEVSKGYHLKPSEQNTVHDDRIYAEEPYYILIERSSRSSVEDDPYIITRGKKYSNFHLPKAVRDRRGAIEDIVKSMQNDPYYIARGKKNSFIKIGNTLMSVESLNRDKDAICGLVNSLLSKNRGKAKREINDSERDRRTILKKLAAQLQEDPYFVSRGKKDANSDNEIKEFVRHIIDTCY